jgi:hypothetical protein
MSQLQQLQHACHIAAAAAGRPTVDCKVVCSTQLHMMQTLDPTFILPL